MQRWAGVLAVLLAMSVGTVLSLSAAFQKSATFDEPLHTYGSFLDAKHGAHVIDIEQPALWHRLMGLWLSDDALPLPWVADPAIAANLFQTYSPYAQTWSPVAVFSDGHGPAVIGRLRCVSSVLLACLIGVVGAWAWQLAGRVDPSAGPWAGGIAAWCAALEPTLLGHGSLVTSDVAFALAWLLLAMAICRVGRNASWLNIALAGLACGAAILTKFSGLLAPLVLVGLVLLRAALPAAWTIGKRVAVSRGAKWQRAAIVIASSAAICYLMTWAAYGLRFHPLPGQDVLMPMSFYAQETRFRQELADGKTPQEAAQLSQLGPADAVGKLNVWMEAHRLLPNAFATGLQYTLSRNQVRRSYLMGQYSDVGHWLFFPIIAAAKTPLSLQVLAVLSVIIAITLGLWRRHWAAACVVGPAAFYLGVSMSQSLNLGLRHLLPMYGGVLVVIGVTAGVIISRRGAARWIALGLLALLAIEVLPKWPNYIAHTNVLIPARTAGWLMTDSNLDWGQDLPLLARWQTQHPGTPMQVDYFGTVPLDAYGVRSVSLGDGPGVLAISQSSLTGIANAPGQADYSQLRNTTPREILGDGTIYLFDWPTVPPGDAAAVPSLGR